MITPTFKQSPNNVLNMMLNRKTKNIVVNINFFTSCIAPTMTVKKCSMVIESMALIFIMASKEVVRPINLTSESLEHTIGSFHVHRRESNVTQCCETKKTKHNLEALFKEDLVTFRTK